jgi:PAS domain-containing protein
MDTHENIPGTSETPEIMKQNTKDPSSSVKQQWSKSLPLRIVTWPYKWLQVNTFSPGFLLGTWSQPIFGYLAAFVGQLVIVIGLLALIHTYTSFGFPEGPLILVILLVALGWGAGPSIVALLIGAVLLIFLVFPPIFSLSFDQSADVIELCLYLTVGLTISILASNIERARRTSERLRLRLDTIIDAIPDSIVLYDLQGRRIQQNRVARELNPFETLPLVRALRGETVVGAELLYRVPFRQQDRLVSISAAPLLTPSGKTIEGAVTITHDLSERKRIEDALRASEEQEHFLSEVNKVLNSSLDYQKTLTSIAKLVVPQLADWFSIDLVNTEGQFELIEVHHKDPELVQWAKALREKYPIDPGAQTGPPLVVRTGQSELYSEITDEMLEAFVRNEEELIIARQIGLTSLMYVPLAASGRTIGIISFVSTESGRK